VILVAIKPVLVHVQIVVVTALDVEVHVRQDVIKVVGAVLEDVLISVDLDAEVIVQQVVLQDVKMDAQTPLKHLKQ